MNKDKPFIDMTEEELDSTWAELGKRLHVPMLNDARSKPEAVSNRVVIAFVVLESAYHSPRVVMSYIESGDNDGVDSCKQFIDDCNRTNLLREEEKLTIQIRETDFGSMRTACA